MTRKWFFLLTILAIAAVAVFVIGPVTDAQRPERDQQRSRSGEMRGASGRRGAMSRTSVIDNSWVDLTFSLKVNDETLIKSRPIYQKHRDNLSKAIEEAGGDSQAMRSAMMAVRNEFNTDLKTVLTDEQIAQLDKLGQERMRRTMNRGGGRRGGGGGRPNRGGG